MKHIYRTSFIVLIAFGLLSFSAWMFNSLEKYKICEIIESPKTKKTRKPLSVTKFPNNGIQQKLRPEHDLQVLISNNEAESDSPALITVNVTDWKKTNIETLSLLQIIDYFLWFNQSACQTSQYFGGVMVSSANGRTFLDGHKVLCLDDKVKPIGTIPGVSKRCLVYSVGINNEWSFDESMELYGCEIFAFDPSMNVSNHNRTKNIHFYQMAVGHEDKEVWENYISIPTRTLSSIYDMMKHVHGYDVIIDYLKMDIEKMEWRVLPQILRSGMMDKVRQLSVEIHLDYDKSVSIYRQHAKILQSIEEYGMIRFDSTPNINSMITVKNKNLSLFSSYEIAWYNEKLSRN